MSTDILRLPQAEPFARTTLDSWTVMEARLGAAKISDAIARAAATLADLDRRTLPEEPREAFADAESLLVEAARAIARARQALTSRG